jgi:hypothetical protein
MTTRQAVKALNQSAQTVASSAKAEKERKAASKAALAAQRKADAATPPLGLAAKPADDEVAETVARGQRIAEAALAEREARKADDARNALAAHRADYEALYYPDGEANGEDHYGSFEAYLADQGVAPDGSPLEAADEPKAGGKPRYEGPMLALKQARRAYVKAANGIACNGDKLALLCGKYSREHTVKALRLALEQANLGGNFPFPYLHLNPGQQSMNLRNKARHAVSNGFLSHTAIEAAYEATK